VLLLAYIAVGWITGSAVEGWTSLMLVVVILGAVQMFVLGMIGEYLGRLYIEAKRRPLYIVADVIGRAAERPHKLGYVAGDAMATSETPGGNGTRPSA
jgi:polyisoprenyl-phosphate glycosyltransferase